MQLKVNGQIIAMSLLYMLGAGMLSACQESLAPVQLLQEGKVPYDPVHSYREDRIYIPNSQVYVKIVPLGNTSLIRAPTLYISDAHISINTWNNEYVDVISSGDLGRVLDVINGDCIAEAAPKSSLGVLDIHIKRANESEVVCHTNRPSSCTMLSGILSVMSANKNYDVFSITELENRIDCPDGSIQQR